MSQEELNPTATTNEPSASAAPAPSAAMTDTADAPFEVQSVAKASADTPDEKEQTEKSAQPAGVFNSIGHWGILLLLLLFGLQEWPDFFHALRGDELFCPAEAGQLAALQQCLRDGTWLAPIDFSPSLWPGFLWFAGGLSLLTNGAPWTYALTAALAFLLLLASVWCMSRAAGYDTPTALSAGMLLLCTPLLTPLSHVFAPSAMAAGLMLFSLSCLCRGWCADSAWGALPLGFVLATLAGLTAGPLYILLPLCASVALVFWRGTFRRGCGFDAVLSFFLMLLILGGWLGAMILLTNGNRYLHELFADMLRSPLPLEKGWWQPLIIALLGTLPWVVSLLCVSWGKVFCKAWGNVKASRKDAAPSAFLWISLACGILIAPAIPTGSLATAVCIAAITVPLLAKTLMRLSPLGSRMFIAVTMPCVFLTGLLLVGAYFSSTRPFVVTVLHCEPASSLLAAAASSYALPVLGGICILFALLLPRFWRCENMQTFLLCSALFATLLTVSATLLLPSALASAPESRLRRLADIAVTPKTMPFASPQSPSALETQDRALQPNMAPNALPGQGVTPEKSSEALAPATPDTTPLQPEQIAPAIPDAGAQPPVQAPSESPKP
ncbi:MAG: hypothetical protein K6F46_06045 [Desulfovibrio sp.]|nr:hypothetical protein [Desulfovibrio sp.]